METSHSPFAPDYYRYQNLRSSHWDKVAALDRRRYSSGRYYHFRLVEIYKNIIPENQHVLELGCADGNLLAALKPKYGVGVDFSEKMVAVAKQLHPELCFIHADVHELNLKETFDYVILSDLINDLWDVQCVFENISNVVTPRTRVIINYYSRVWELPLELAEKIGVKRPNLQQNWLTLPDVKGLLSLTDFGVVKSWQEILFPIKLPLISKFFNKFLAKLWPFKEAALTNFIIARYRKLEESPPRSYTVSVIVPARNEAENIPVLFERAPKIGEHTEYIFIEGHSKDQTETAIQHEIQLHPEIDAKFFKQSGSGKGDAVRLGFEHASGDIFMILDSDLSVAPEDLNRFYEAITHGKGELINGVRLVYPMEKQAMQFFNIIGNKIFGLLISWVLNNPIKDTLCGTKVLWKQDYEKIAQNRQYFGDFDPFGDYDLLFGAARLGLHILDLPVRYRERKYGTTNIQRWKHGWILFKMFCIAAYKIKFS